MATLLAACGGGGGGASRESSANQPAAPAQRNGTGDKDAARTIIGNTWNAVDGAPRYGGILQYAPTAPALANLDPILSASAMVHQVVGNSYSRLIKIGRKPDDQNALVIFPDAADTWETTDPTTLTFHLRDNVKFHNVAPTNGRALTAEDVKYSIERSANDKTSQFRGAFGALDSVQAPDAKTVVVKLKRYDATLPRNLAGNTTWLVPRELAESANGLKNAVAGTGPFIFERWEQDSAVYFKKNPEYFLKGVPFVDELRILIINDQDARITAFQTGQAIQMALSGRQAQRVKQAAPTVQAQRYPYVSPYVLFMNFNEPIWKDDRVRKAVSLALDPDAIIKVAADGEGLWRGVVSNQHPGWSPSQDDLKSNKYYLRRDVAEAKKLLAAAGHPDGFSTGLMFNTSYPQAYTSSTQYMQQAFAEIGVKVELNGLEQATFRRNQDIQNYKGLIHGLDGQGQPEAFLLDYRTGGPKNGSGFSDSEIDRLIDDCNATIDEEQRRSKALDLQRRLLGDVLYKIAIRDEFLQDMWHPWVKNLFSAPPHFYPLAELAYVWLEK
ncbi:MAG: ABC transporter substrate-binding protein [Dehalococcoidia bacterium]